MRTIIAIESAQKAQELTAANQAAHDETYIAIPDRENTTLSLARRQGPRWALAPLLAHQALAGRYKWLLLGHDDTLWRPSQAVALLAPFNVSLPYLVSDHLADFNGRQLLTPSHAPTACLPAHVNLTQLSGRKKPPGVPWAMVPCRPPVGCEFRWEACMGVAGGPLCHSKRFLGSGDRCPPSWHSSASGLALSVGLMAALREKRYGACALNYTRGVGERVLARCMWRSGYAYTLPGLALIATKRAFDDRFIAFNPPYSRPALIDPAWAKDLPPGANSSLRCDGDCIEWARAHAVSVHVGVAALEAGAGEVEEGAQKLEAVARRLAGG